VTWRCGCVNFGATLVGLTMWSARTWVTRLPQALQLSKPAPMDGPSRCKGQRWIVAWLGPQQCADLVEETA
jgi:hypothetical protein